MTKQVRGKYMPEWQDYEERDGPIWEKLCEQEPRLVGLYNELLAIEDDKRKRSYCANQIWYGANGWGYKQRLCNLVGWGAKGADKFLRSSTAYDVAYRKLYSALPDCRNCNCM